MKKRFKISTSVAKHGHAFLVDTHHKCVVDEGPIETMMKRCADENAIHDRHRLYLRFCRLGYNLTAAMSIWFASLLALFIFVDDPVEMTITAACIFFMNLIISLLDSILFEPEDS